MNEHLRASRRRQKKDEAFSMNNIQDRIDTAISRKGAPTRETLHTLASVARTALRRSRGDSVYANEVIVSLASEDVIYTVRDGEHIPASWTYDSESEPVCLYGYVDDFEVVKLVDEPGSALCGRIEAYEDGMTDTYLVPLAYEDRVDGVEVTDVPHPMIEGDQTQQGHSLQETELDEEMRRYLGIARDEVLASEFLSTARLQEMLSQAWSAGHLSNIDHFTTAFNLYLQEQVHDNDPFVVEVTGVEMDLVGLDMSLVDEGLDCRLYVVEEDGSICYVNLDDKNFEIRRSS